MISAVFHLDKYHPEVHITTQHINGFLCHSYGDQKNVPGMGTFTLIDCSTKFMLLYHGYTSDATYALSSGYQTKIGDVYLYNLNTVSQATYGVMYHKITVTSTTFNQICETYGYSVTYYYRST